jgi:hypothetical protein
VSDLKSYLLSKGWAPQPVPGSQGLLFEGPLADDGEPIVQFVPGAEAVRDYRMRVEELFRALSKIEDRPAADILYDVLTPDGDRVTFRLDGPGTRTGALGLDQAVRFLQAARRFLLAAAGPPLAALLRPDRWRVRVLPGDAFAVAVELPLGPPGEGQPPPPERRLSLALPDQLALLGQDLAGNGVSSANAELCEALRELLLCALGADARLKIGLAWGRSWPGGGPNAGPFVFPDGAAERLQQIARSVREAVGA